MLSKIFLLTKRKLKESLNLSMNTLFLFIQPLLWLLIFLFIRQSKLDMFLPNGTTTYVNYLVLGVFPNKKYDNKNLN